MSVTSPTLLGIVWWPHSGGRWLCRSLIKPHKQVYETAFVHPWLFFSTDMTMEVDITAQVHKARSMPDLKEHLVALKGSIDHGRIEGLRAYFHRIRQHYLATDAPETVIAGEMCLGSPIPRAIDLTALFEAVPDFRLLHLVRNPVHSFPSFAVRHEMDGDPVKVAGSWLTLNAQIRVFFEQHPDLRQQYLMVRYEDLIQQPEAELARIFAFAGLPNASEVIANQGERWGRNTRPEVSPQLRTLIETIAGPELQRHGYALSAQVS